MTGGNTRIEVIPIRILLFNELDFPAALPLFQSLLSVNRGLRGAELLEMYQPVNLIFLRKPTNEFLAMLVDPSHKIIRDADVECSAYAARKDVDPVFAFSLDLVGR
jgi:hypothetical protein